METRFGYTHDVVQRVLKSVNNVAAIIETKYHDEIRSAFNELYFVRNLDNTATAPALQAFV